MYKDLDDKWYKFSNKWREELIKFSRKTYPDWTELTPVYIEKLFNKYKDTTLIYIENNEIRGFVVYQNWPDVINMILICLDFDVWKNLHIMRKGLNQAKIENTLPNKPIVFWDDERMEARRL